MTSVALPGLALAQSATSGDTTANSNFARDRNVGVRERPHPEYEAQGLRLGSFTAYPRLELAVEHDDNIFPSSIPPQDESDNIWRVKPDISIESNWSRHELDLWAGASLSRYQDFDSENTSDWNLGAHSRLDFAGRTTVELRAEHAALTEPRSSSNASTLAKEPVQYVTDDLSAGIAKEFNRLKLGAAVDLRKFDYEDVARIGGGVIDQDDRDRTITALTVRGDYAVSPATAVFVELVSNTRDFDKATLVPIATPPFLASAKRDSSGYSVLAGVNFELSSLTRGEIGVGYLTQDYDDNHFGDVDGFAFRGKLEWFPTQLTTVTLRADRTVEDSGLGGVGGYLFTDLGFQLDHELLRNVILSAQLSKTRSEYQGVDRTDDRWLGAVSATWLVNRRVGVNVGYTHLNQDSTGAFAGPDFDDNKLGAALILQF